ncbi:MAG: hypothetical protein J6V01_02895 [Clostridia bacterium]|nr:hypothetical protein [Clostridia bacterium]
MFELKAGFSQVDITPERPEEVFLDGYGKRLGPAEAVRDHLYAKVCLLRSGESEFALFSVDFCGFSAAVKDRLCTWIEFLGGIKRENFALCATHTHAAPACGVLTGLPLNTIYLDSVAQKMAQALKEARERAVPGRFGCAFGDDLTLGYNRRGNGHDEIDRRVFVWGFFDFEGKLRGALASASCHAVCSTDMRISADYPGVMTMRAGERYPGVPVLFLQGRGADIDPQIFGEEGIVRLGEQLSGCVFTGLERAASAPAVSGGIKSAFSKEKIPFGKPDGEKLAKEINDYSKKLAAAPDARQRRAISVKLYWALKSRSDCEKTEPPRLDADLQMLKIGDRAAIAFVPFEMLTVTGNAVESILGSFGVNAPHCLVLGYSNGTNGYLCPSAEADEAGYETAGAARWYGLPECSAETEKAVLRGVHTLAAGLFG